MSDMEQALKAAADYVRWPHADVTGVVARRLSEGRTRRRSWLRPVLVTAAALAILIATPAGREAVANLLEVVGIRLEQAEPSGPPPGSEMQLGQLIDEHTAPQRVTFELLRPESEQVGSPDAVYHATIPAGGAVHMVWSSDRRLPAAGERQIGMIYSQFQVGTGETFVKSLGPTQDVTDVAVRGHRGFWIEGEPHLILFVDSEGDDINEQSRLAANVLAWTEGGVTHRIETTLDLTETLELAESLVPLD